MSYLVSRADIADLHEALGHTGQAEQYRAMKKPECICYPHGPDEPCTCPGCWACDGYERGCTCDINWDCEHYR